ncbi:MAG: peptide chain release factor 2 [Ruminococcaceae bacterium]|nr:peptide chain release factor 2 [Oscillospiraceae bacterium]
MIILDEYKQNIDEISLQLDEIITASNVPELLRNLDEIERKTLDPEFWTNPEDSREIMTKKSSIESKLDSLQKLKDKKEELEILLEIAETEEDKDTVEEISKKLVDFRKAVEGERLSTLFGDEYDGNNAIITLHSGAGGTEAQDWVEMLYRMYTRFAQNHGFKVEVLDFQEGDEAGIKSVSAMISGKNAYGYLKSENGVHRLVRVSPFDSSGRRHTSFASLEVIPEISEDVDVKINDEDIRVDTYRSSGAGGQHVNKTESAIRITHIPTGIVVSCQNQRSQHQNREVAMKMLKSKLIKIKEQEHLDRVEDIKGDQMDIAWGSQIRSYVFMPYTLVKDHRTGYEVGNINAVMDGDIDGFISEYLTQLSKDKLN